MVKKIEEATEEPKIWRFEKYVEIMVEKDKAIELFGKGLGEFLADDQAVVLIPVASIVDAESVEVLDGEPQV
jgi:hypothetical protein